MNYRKNKELSVRRVLILYSSLTKLREEISPIQSQETIIKEAYAELENAFSKVFEAEAKFQAEI